MTDTGSAREIALRDVSPGRPAHHSDGPYQLFLAVSLGLALFGGFTLALLLPVAAAREWNWGTRWQEMAQAHGQLQLLGFAGLFIAGMTLRLMPRFSGRPLANSAAAHWIVALVGVGVLLRSLAAVVDHRLLHDGLFLGGAICVLGGSIAFAGVIMPTLLHFQSKAEATAWFFVLGAAGLVAAASLNLALTVRAIDGDMRMTPAAENNALVFLELHGFVMMFIGGVTTRAVPALVGRQRSHVIAKFAAVALAVGAAAHTGLALFSAIERRSTTVNRLSDLALLIVAGALLLIVWATGIFHPRANRVAAASRTQFWFIRAAFGWLLAGLVLLSWYASRSLVEGTTLDQFETDAVRHILTVGVVTMTIVGMAMLIVPEFAARRMRHPNEHRIIWAMLIGANASAALRVWPAMEGTRWLESGRYWPMAAAGALALTVLAMFAFMFTQSYLEQRRDDGRP